MGNIRSRLVSVTAHTRFPHFKHFIEVAPGFFNLRAPFYMLHGTLNIGTHMSVCEVAPGSFVALDCCELTDAQVKELDELTENGERLAAVLTTHPFHTLSIKTFHVRYPSNAPRRGEGTLPRQWYGCPRHLNITSDAADNLIVWAGDLNDCEVRRQFEPSLRMSIPAGAEFVDPKPPTRNHLSCVLVLHVASRTVHVDDCLCWIEGPGLLMRLAQLKDKSLHWHMSLTSVGLLPTAESPLQFKQWAQSILLEAWDYDTLVTAHKRAAMAPSSPLRRAPAPIVTARYHRQKMKVV